MIVLLITGAIDLSSYNIPATVLCNVERRLSQYISGIWYAIDHYTSITHLVFCENTNFNYDYSDLKGKARLSGKILEVLTFSGDYSAIQQKGKGYGEGEIIHYALENSQYLKKCRSFYKLTGRLKVVNMDKIITSTISGSAFDYFPGAIYNRSKDHIETIFYKTDKELYLKLLNDIFQEVNESEFQYLEHLFNQRLRDSKIISFKIAPKISGQSGTTGRNYDKPLLEQSMEMLYYMIGVHNIHRSFIEKVLVNILSKTLGLWRKAKVVM